MSPKDDATFFASIGDNISVECSDLSEGSIHYQLLVVRTNGTKNGSKKIHVIEKPTQFSTEGQEGTSLKKNIAIFFFNNISKADFGSYTCMAGNAVGYHTKTFTIMKFVVQNSTIKPSKEFCVLSQCG